MYKKYFGFKERPFKLLPNPAYLFVSPSHEKALAHLIYAVKEGDGLFMITGEAGTGKTTLCRSFIEKLDDNVDVAYIFTPGLNAIELFKTVCSEFGISVEHNSTIKDLNDAFRHFLHTRKADGKHVMLIIDEAQKLSLNTMEQIRLLSNLETSREKLLQIVLVGQPELNDLLNKKELQQLQQRITLNCRLLPLTFEESMRYIQRRIRVAAQRDRVLFDVQAFRKIYSFSNGIPRLINIICDKALLCAFVTNHEKVGGAVVDSAIQQSLPSRQEKFRQRGNKITKTVLATCMVCLAAFLSVVAWPTVSNNIPKLFARKTYNVEEAHSQNTSAEIASPSFTIDTSQSSMLLPDGNNLPVAMASSDSQEDGSLFDNGISREAATEEAEPDISEPTPVLNVPEKKPMLASAAIPAVYSTPDANPSIPIEPYVENNLPENKTIQKKQNAPKPVSETKAGIASDEASDVEPASKPSPATDKPSSTSSVKSGRLEKQAEPSKKTSGEKRPLKEAEQIKETEQISTPPKQSASTAEGKVPEQATAKPKPEVSEPASSSPAPEKKVLLASAPVHVTESISQSGQGSDDEPPPSEEKGLSEKQSTLEQNAVEKDSLQMTMQPESETLVANLSRPAGNIRELEKETASRVEDDDVPHDSIYKPNEVDKKPKLVRSNALIYPEGAKRQDIDGWVVLQFIVDAKGRTEDAEVLDADPKGFFEEAALDAVEKYKFRPAEKNGKEVDCIVKQRIRFKLD